MKIVYACVALFVGFVVGAVVVWMLPARYQFMTSGGNAPVLYRCDRLTGNVTVAVRNYNSGDFTWRAVENPWSPPASDKVVSKKTTERPLFTDEDFFTKEEVAALLKTNTPSVP